MYKPPGILEDKSSRTSLPEKELRKANFSTKFSSSKLLKDQDYYASQKNLGGFDKIEELPESSFNSSMNSNAFNWRDKKLDPKNGKLPWKVFPKLYKWRILRTLYKNFFSYISLSMTLC